MDRAVHYYPRAALPLHETVPGARMWGVALEQTLLTYFEVAPHCRFERHRHDSEQITMVLEGVLYFEANDTVIAVGAGEVMAIPSDVPHAVFTQGEAVKAVDAWSPVLEKYAQEGEHDGPEDRVRSPWTTSPQPLSLPPSPTLTSDHNRPRSDGPYDL